MPAHTCHARGCGVAVPRRMFMCKRHWYMLPRDKRDAVWAVYVEGQEEDMSKVTEEYLAVTRDAINWLRENEGTLL